MILFKPCLLQGATFLLISMIYRLDCAIYLPGVLAPVQKKGSFS